MSRGGLVLLILGAEAVQLTLGGWPVMEVATGLRTLSVNGHPLSSSGVRSITRGVQWIVVT